MVIVALALEVVVAKRADERSKFGFEKLNGMKIEVGNLKPKVPRRQLGDAKQSEREPARQRQ